MMSTPVLILLVRFGSPLNLHDVTEVVEKRISEFRALTGLRRKYYLQDTDTSEYAGLNV